MSFFENTRKPEGFGGRVMVSMMNLGHRALARWGLRFLMLQKDARVLVCVYAVNGARGFLAGLWQLLLILSVMNLADRLGIDGWWVGHTKAWIIPGTEDLRPHITAADKRKKWMAGTVGMAVIAAVLAGIMVLLVR